jgi:hypothetical protein
MKKLMVILWNFVIISLTTVVVIFCRVELPEMQKEIYNETIIRNNLIYKKIMQNIDNDLAGWKPNINEAVSELTSINGSLSLAYCMAKDKIMGTSCTQERITEVINRYILVDSVNTFKKLEKSLNALIQELNGNRAIMLKEIASKTSSEFEMSFAELNKHLELASNSVENIAIDTSINTGILVSSSFGIKTIIKQAKNVLSAIIRRFLITQKVSGALLVADGPLPIFDGVALVIEIVGTGWAAYDLYKAQTVLKDKVKQSFIAGVNNFRRQIYSQSVEIADEILSRQNKINLELLRELNNYRGTNEKVHKI